MRFKKKAIAGLLAALQIAWSFSAGAYEALAQSHMAPVNIPVSAAIPAVSASAAAGLTTLGQPLPASQLLLSPSLIQTGVPSAVAPVRQVPALARAAAPRARLAAVERAAKTDLQPARRDVATEGSSQEAAQAFAQVYGEKLIGGEASPLLGEVHASAAPSASAVLHARPEASLSKSNAPSAIEAAPVPAASTPAPRIWQKPAVQAALGAAAIAAAVALFGAAAPGSVILSALGIPWIFKLGVPWLEKNRESGPKAAKDVALAGPLMWFAAASLLSLYSFGIGSSTLFWNMTNSAGVIESLIILGQLNYYKKDVKAMRATALTVAGVAAAVTLIASQALMPLSVGLTVGFWAAMGLLGALDGPQIQRNYRLFTDQGRTPDGISTASKALLVLGSLLHFYTAITLPSLSWAINAGIAVVMGSTILAQMHLPRQANAVLGPIIRAIEKIVSLLRPTKVVVAAADEEARGLVAKEFAGTDYTRFKSVSGKEALGSLMEKVKALPGRSAILLEAPTAAGKSTLSEELNKALPGRIAVFPVDRYFRPVEEVPTGVDGKPDFDHPQSLYLERAADDLKTLLEGGRVELPLHIINGGTRFDSGEFMQLDKDDVVIVDSIYASHELFVKAAQTHKTLNVYLTAPTAVRFARRLKRDIVERGISAEKNLQMWPQILINESVHILPLRAKADVVINLVGENELKALPETYAEILSKEWASSGKDARVTELFARMLRASIAADAVPAPMLDEAPQVDVTGTPQSPERLKLLIEQALKTYAAVQDEHAHKKNYSGFHVHAAVELADGRWFSAGNQELSRELTLCAERAAIMAALEDSKIAQVVRTIVVSNSGGEFKKLCAECLSWLATGKYFSPDTQVVSVARDAATGRFALKIRTVRSVLPFHAPNAGLPSLAQGPIDSLPLTLSPRAESLRPSPRDLASLMTQARDAYINGSAETFSPNNPAAAAVSLAPFGHDSAVRFQWAPRFSEAEDLRASASVLERVTRLQARLRPIVHFIDRATFGVMRLEQRLLSAPKIAALAYYGKDADLPRIPSFGRLVKQGATRDTLILRIENDRLVVRALDEYMTEIYGLP